LRPVDTDPVVILGAGFAGLGSAAVLRAAGVPYLILERESTPGGLARTDRIGEYLFDQAGHFIHRGGRLFDATIAASGVEFEEHTRRSAVLIDYCIVPYPLQFNLWAAPAPLRRAVELEIDALPAEVAADVDFASLVEQAWGQSLAETFFIPYAEKLWRRPSSDLPADWAGRFIPRRDVALLRRGLQQPLEGYGYNARFLYPRSGRMGEFADALAAPHRACLLKLAEVVAVDLERRIARCANGEAIVFSSLINTLPLNRFLQMSGQPCGGELTYANLINLRVGFRGDVRVNEHWLYIPDRRAAFFRVGFPKNVNRLTCAPACCSLSLEYGVGVSDCLPADPLDLARDALDYLGERGVLDCERIEVVDAKLIAPAYVVHRMSSTPSVQRIADGLREKSVMLAGRFGAWDYLSLAESVLSGEHAARQVMAMRTGT
jgi:protoporphyrinogen oxidase